MRYLIVKLIEIYQATLSPDHGWLKAKYPYGFCKYHPSCSEYTKQAVKYNGVILGIFMGAFRIVRCNPWSKGGIDKVKIYNS